MTEYSESETQESQNQGSLSNPPSQQLGNNPPTPANEPPPAVVDPSLRQSDPSFQQYNTSRKETTPPTTSDRGSATILATTQDNVFQPDSLRGHEHLLKDLDVTDQEEERRQALRDQTPEQNR